MHVILASASPRRQELLAIAGFSFEVMPANVDETADPTLSPPALVSHLAMKKAHHIFRILGAAGCFPEDAVVLGADTVVVLDGQVLGKPTNEADAFRMLSALQGQAHTVYTGCALVFANGQARTFVSHTEVTMRALSPESIQAYINTGEPMDKAGAYGIQARGATLVEKIVGDYFTVVGLPLCRLTQELQKGVPHA